MTDATQARERPTGRLLVLIGALTTLGSLSLHLYLPGLPALGRDLSVSASAAQLTITAGLAGLALGQLLIGPVSDARGRRRLALGSISLFLVASALCVVAPTLEALIAFRLVQGLAAGANLTIVRAMVRDVTTGGTDTARAFATLMTVTSLSPLLAPIAGGLLLYVTDWRGTFAVMTAVTAVLLTAAALTLPETLPPARRRTGGAATVWPVMAGLLRDRAFVGYALCVGLGFATISIYLAGGSFLLEEVHGASPGAFAAVFGINGIGLFAAANLSRRLVGRVGPGRLLAIGLSVGAVASIGFLVGTVFDAGLWVLLPCLFVLVASRGVASPNAQALALTGYPQAAGTASGLIGVCQFGIGAAVAPLAGLGGPTATMPMAVALAATAIASCAVLALSVGAGRRRAALPPA